MSPDTPLFPKFLSPEDFFKSLGLPWPPFAPPKAEPSPVDKAEPIVKEVIREVPAKATPATYVTVGAPGVSVGAPQVYVNITSPAETYRPPPADDVPSDEDQQQALTDLELRDVISGGATTRTGQIYADIMSPDKSFIIQPSAMPLDVSVWGWDGRQLDSRTYRDWIITDEDGINMAVGTMDDELGWYIVRVEVDKGA